MTIKVLSSHNSNTGILVLIIGRNLIDAQIYKHDSNLLWLFWCKIGEKIRNNKILFWIFSIFIYLFHRLRPIVGHATQRAPLSLCRERTISSYTSHLAWPPLMWWTAQRNLHLVERSLIFLRCNNLRW